MNTYTKDKQNVAIVGGGVSGLYLAWRILSTSCPASVHIFEKSSRTGGRLATARLPLGADSTVQVEEGGMRFLDRHLHLNWLLEKLGLSKDIQRFGMGTDENFFYLRGKSFSLKEAMEGRPEDGSKDSGFDGAQAVWSSLYNLDMSERKKTPKELLDDVVNSFAENNRQKHPESALEWRHFKECVEDGRSLNDWGLKPLLFHHQFSREAVAMLEGALGFSCPFDMQINAGAALQLFANFPSEPQFKTLKGGYEELTIALRKEVEKFGATIHSVAKALAVKRKQNEDRLELRYRYNDREHSSTFDKVVLAVPPRDLARIDLSTLKTKKMNDLDRLLNYVVEMPLTKINFFYHECWWKESRFKVKHGGCFTDLPLAQVYFFDSPEEESSSAQVGSPVLTIYSDGRNAMFWRQLQEFGGGAYTEIDLDLLTSCSEAVVKEATRQLSLMFGMKVTKPVAATYRAWGNSETGSGDHLWKIGTRTGPRSPEIYNPADNLFLCGEAFSEEQAWVEGALASAEMVAQKGFDAPDLAQELRALAHGTYK